MASTISASIGNPVSRQIAAAKRNEGVAFPALTFVIMERSQPTFTASAASVIPTLVRCSANFVMATNVNVMNVNVKHNVHDIAWTRLSGDAKM